MGSTPKFYTHALNMGSILQRVGGGEPLAQHLVQMLMRTWAPFLQPWPDHCRALGAGGLSESGTPLLTKNGHPDTMLSSPCEY